MKLIITGSTGMIGKGVLLEALADERISNVLVINREPVGVTDPKLKEIIHKDFLDLSAIEDQLAGYDACLFCLGISSFRMSEADYTRITYDLSVHVAETLMKLNDNMVMCFISGAGTDSTEQGSTMWARVKGKAENYILNAGFKDAYIFRPAFIEPRKGTKSKTPIYNVLITAFKPVFPLIRRMKKYATATDTLGKAMINVAIDGYGKKVLESVDINEVGTA